MTDKPTFYTVYGEYFRYQNKKDSALVFYKKAIAVSNDNSEAKRRLATLDSNFKNDEINLSDPVETYNKLAESFNAAKYGDALRYTDILIKMNFNIEGVYYMKAGIHLNLKDTTNALKSFSKVIETGVNDSYKFNSLYNRGVIYYQQNQFKKALSDFQSALKIKDPGRDQLAESLRNLVKDCKRRLKKTAKPR